MEQNIKSTIEKLKNKNITTDETIKILLDFYSVIKK